MPQVKLNSLRYLKALLHAAFFVSGITTVLIGQILPLLAERLKLDDRQAGLFFIVQFSGSLAGTLLTSRFGRKKRFLRAVTIGCFLIAGGVLLLNFDSLALCFIGFFINGLGFGLTLPATNMLTFELNPQKAPAALNILNFFWGVGAILSQPFVDFLSHGTSVMTTTVALAAVASLIAALLCFASPEIEQNKIAASLDEGEPFVPIWTNPTAWLIALFGFVHVGFESGMGGWLKTYTRRIEGETNVDWFPPIFLYFLFFVAGRGIAPVFFRFLDENKVLLGGVLTILFGMVILLFAGDVPLLSVGASIAGFGTASVFPTNVSRFTKTFGVTAARRATPLFICGTLGAAFTTWLIGFVSNYYQNDLRAGMSVMLGSVLLLVALQIFLMFRRTERQN